MFPLLFCVLGVVGAASEETFQLPSFSKIAFDENSPVSKDVNFWTTALDEYGQQLVPCALGQATCNTSALEMSTFAALQLDSFGKIPANFMRSEQFFRGSFSECMHVSTVRRPRYRTQFCEAYTVTPIAVLGLIDSSNSGLTVNNHAVDAATTPAPTSATNMCRVGLPTMFMDICMPESCTKEDIMAILKPKSTPLLSFCDVVCRPNDVKNTPFFWIFSSFMIISSAIVVVATVVDYVLYRLSYKERLSGLNVLLAFSFFTNGAEILNMEQRKGQIVSIHCIRFFSITWVLFGHVLANVPTAADNAMKIQTILKHMGNDIFTNASFSVDSFFFLSGLLLAYLFYKEMDKSPRKMKQPITWIMFYVHRYLRLTPPYMLFLAFVAAYTKHLVHSPIPLMNTILDQDKVCRENWWKHVLYINNFYPQNKQCYGISWYLGVDMQLHIAAPLILIPLFYSKLAGFLSAVILFTANIAYTMAVYIHFDLPPTSLGAEASANNDFMKWAYQMPVARFSPYLIGILTGYFMHKTSGRKLKMHWIPICCMWILAITLALTVLLGLHDYINGHHLSRFASGCYYTFSRIGWALALAWLVVAIQQDWAGPIKNFMEQPFWAPLGRLTYCLYLVHYMVLLNFVTIPESPPHYDSIFYLYISYAIPIVVLSLVAAFIWSCMFEIPSMKLEKMFIERLLGGGNATKSNAENDAKPNLEGQREGELTKV